MPTTPDPVKGVPRISGDPSPLFRADFNSLADYFIAEEDQSVANVGALPASGNWPGRKRFVISDLTLRVWTGSAWVVAVPSPTTFHVREEQPANTDAGTFTAGAWQKRTLNTVKVNEISGASVTSSVITLPAGTYDVDATAPAYAVDNHKLRLRQTSGTAADLVIGESQFAQQSNGASTATGNSAHLRGRFTLAAPQSVELQHQCGATLATFGLGRRSNFGVVEVYAEILFRKIA